MCERTGGRPELTRSGEMLHDCPDVRLVMILNATCVGSRLTVR